MKRLIFIELIIFLCFGGSFVLQAQVPPPPHSVTERPPAGPPPPPADRSSETLLLSILLVIFATQLIGGWFLRKKLQDMEALIRRWQQYATMQTLEQRVKILEEKLHSEPSDD